MGYRQTDDDRQAFHTYLEVYIFRRRIYYNKRKDCDQME